MPARLPQEIRLQVIQLYIQGYSSENVASKLNIAHSQCETLSRS